MRAGEWRSVQVPAVRHSPAVVADWWQRVPFDHHNALEPLRQYPGREQARHAGAQNDGLIDARVALAGQRPHLLAPRRTSSLQAKHPRHQEATLIRPCPGTRSGVFRLDGLPASPARSA